MAGGNTAASMQEIKNEKVDLESKFLKFLGFMWNPLSWVMEAAAVMATRLEIFGPNKLEERMITGFMEKLPDDTVIDIFSRLPAKSIGISRCVSKPWRSLLSQPYFIKTHLNQTKQSPTEQQALLVSSDSHTLYSTQPNFAHNVFDKSYVVASKVDFVNHLFSSYRIYGVATCDGLILILDEQKKLTLINPTTKEIKVLPRPLTDLGCDSVSGFLPMFGVGYDSVYDDYKVITISYCRHGEFKLPQSFVTVYSVRNGSWKRAENSSLFIGNIHGAAGVFVNGYIHWVTYKASDSTLVIAAFDISEEKFRLVSPPTLFDNGICRWHNHLDFDLSGGCLILSIGTFGFWKLQLYDVKESWTWNESSVHKLMMPMQVKLVRYGGRFPILTDVRLVRHRFIINNEMMVRNLEEDTFHYYDDMEQEDTFHYNDDMELHSLINFTESLVSPHSEL